MPKGFWLEECPVGITVCDRRGKALEMNKAAAKTFAKQGGKRLIGKDLLSCHPQRARAKLERLLRSGRPNVYTIEKKGRKKLIYQGPWHRRGRYRGLVELSIVLPDKLPHFKR
ncbi:MAG: PAS domain-containing protein [Elusimicrobiota bacterium]